MNSTAALNNLTKAQKVELLTLLEERARRDKDRLALIDYGKLYPWQREFNAATKDYFSSMLMAANQVGKCVTYQTLIDTKAGQYTIGALFERGLPFDVMAWNGERLVPARASAPFLAYKNESCVRLLLSNGRWIEAALRHRVLTSAGYCYVERLLESVPCLPPSTRECDLLAHAGDDRHWSGIPQGYRDDCSADSHPCDARPPTDPVIAPAFAPLQADVRPRGSVLSDLGAWVSRCTHTLQRVFGRPSSLGGPRQSEDLCAEWQGPSGRTCAELMSDCTGNVQRIELESSDQFQSSGEAGSYQSLALLDPLKARIRIIGYIDIGRHDVYDFSVAEYENYQTAGLIHHNSRTGCLIDSFHLTGNYPEDWEGHRFDGPITAWLLGFSGEKTRDLLQGKLFGRMMAQAFEGGYIPASLIIDHKAMSGTAGAVREVRVRHVSGGYSVCQFWSYSQGQHALMGDVVDWFHIDEEPKDKAIYPQVLTRTINGDKGRGGRGILTFTPENGRTELVVQFMDNPGTGDYLQRARWDDAPHLSEATKERLLSQYPVWQRDMRSKGEPLLGAGLIFDIDPNKIKIPAFECPDHWYRINGMDFGWDHPQAHVQLWIDRDTDTVYLAHAYKASKTKPYEAWQQVRAWAKGIPTAWPHDGLQHEKGTGEEQAQSYRDEGWTMLPEHAQWLTGGNSVEQGLVELYKAMDDGKFKVFSHLSDFFAEMMNYHRDENGKVVKVQDDILSAVRYAWMMKRHAQQKVKKVKAVVHQGSVGWMG